MMGQTVGVTVEPTAIEASRDEKDRIASTEHKGDPHSAVPLPQNVARMKDGQ